MNNTATATAKETVRRQVPIHLANRRLKRRCVLWK